MHTAYIGMGSNIVSSAGSPEATLALAAERLESLGRVSRRSSLYSTEPVGLAAQPRFTNAVVGLETDLSPLALLEKLLDIEKEFGRDRSLGTINGPRTLDLDILLIGDLRIQEQGLEIPHPRMMDRAFVLIPLHEVAPNLIHPSSRQSVTKLLEGLIEQPESDDHAVVQVQSAVWKSDSHGTPRK